MRGYVRNKAEVVTRLRKVEGQVRGLQRMVASEEYCIDIITQISAASSALKRVAVSLLEDHIDHCVRQAADGPQEVRAEKVAEASAAIGRLIKA